MTGAVSAGLLFVALLLGPAFTWSTIVNSQNFIDPQVAAMKVGAVFLALATAFFALTRKALPWRRSSLHVPAALMLAWVAAGILWSPSRPLALESSLWLLCGLVFMVFTENFCSEENAPQALSAIVLLSSLFALLGVLQSRGIDLLPEKSRYFYAAEPFMRVYAVFGNPNLLASVLAATIPAGIWLAIRYRSRMPGILCALGAALQIVCLSLTSARGAWIAAAMGILALAAFSLRDFKRLVALSFVLIAVCVSGVFIFTRQPSFGKEISGKTRGVTWQVTWKMALEHPVRGVGPGQFRYLYLENQRKFFRDKIHLKYARLMNLEKPRNAHNDYLETFAEGGLVGLFLLLLLIARAFLPVLRGWSEYSVPAAAGIVAICFDMLFSFPLHVPATLLMFWIFIGICSGAAVSNKVDCERAFPRWMTTPFAQLELIAISIVLAFWLGNASLAQLQSQMSLMSARRALVSDRIELAQTSAVRSARLDPNNGEAQFIVGAILMMQEKYSEALAHFAMARQTSDDPRLRMNIALALARLRDFPAAMHEAEIARGMIPAHTLPLKILAYIQTLKGDPAAALPYLRRALILDPTDMEVRRAVAAMENSLNGNRPKPEQ